ncbi:nucleotidyltransferase family protein [Candidatus Uabimicrobium amorphum]|uniref:Nucleotidyltransferase n=1 Tax=Uabimicrobium amorphum TaxID=2596890 RepID=A0A5S9IUD7_UABAM|nr:nucleotidyltransferase family protein [Candidatus Uabimicrobium amorphum]BBM87741.1 nucleotidyltransferase [Candidatus Uabimicrobium amorphum]
MKDGNLYISKNNSIKNAIKKLDETGKKILVVVEEDRLIGVVTDGDIRRWILQNESLNDKVEKIMNRSPKYLHQNEIDNANDFMIENGIDAVPIVDDHHQVVDMYFLSKYLNENFHKENLVSYKVIVMAGGKGTRLKPYTNILPKPLIPIGNITILERVMNAFHSHGCQDFYLTINHKANMIRAYLSEVTKSYNIHYVEEDKPLGTAGSLSLIPKEDFQETFFISNCDILVKGNYSSMLKYHKDNKNKITLITSLKHFTIPYGVINISNDGDVKEIIEKPEYDFLVNTGMYIVEPECLNEIPRDTFFHITDLIQRCLDIGYRIGTYPVSEKSWLDMGQMKEMENMLKSLSLNLD